MDEKENSNQTSQNPDLSNENITPVNNLNNEMIPDQNNVDVPKPHSNININLDDLESMEENDFKLKQEEDEGNLNYDSSVISNLNKELSNLSINKGGEGILPEEIEVVKNINDTIYKPISQDKKILSSENSIKNNLPKKDQSLSSVKIISEIKNDKPEEILQNEKITSTNTENEPKIPITPEEDNNNSVYESEERETFTKPVEKDNEEKKPLIAVRTYKNDLAEVIKKNKISLTDTVLAEEMERSGNFLKTFPTIKKSSRKKIYLSILSLFLIFSGITFVFFVYYYKPVPIIKVEGVEIKSFVFSEYQREIFLENKNSIKLTNSIQTELNNTNLPIGSLLHFYLTEKYQKEDGVIGKGTLKTAELFSLVSARVSEIFLRFVDPNFMYGYYSSSENFPFIILKTKSFDNTFPEMLLWEKTLIKDLRPIFIENKPAISSSDLYSKEFIFKDIIINNKDTRAVLNDAGEIIFIYAFVDKSTIVITTNKIALQEIIDRLTISYRER